MIKVLVVIVCLFVQCNNTTQIVPATGLSHTFIQHIAEQ